VLLALSNHMAHSNCSASVAPLVRVQCSVTQRTPLPRIQLAQRLRSGLLLLLNLGLACVLVNLLWVVPVGSQDLFGLYYAPLFPLVTMLWFWTAFVAYCERRHVRYEVCFSSEDQKYLMHSDKLFLVGREHLEELGRGTRLAASYSLASPAGEFKRACGRC